jgi:hypothetical protein
MEIRLGINLPLLGLEPTLLEVQPKALQNY